MLIAAWRGGKPFCLELYALRTAGGERDLPAGGAPSLSGKGLLGGRGLRAGEPVACSDEAEAFVRMHK